MYEKHNKIMKNLLKVLFIWFFKYTGIHLLKIVFFLIFHVFEDLYHFYAKKLRKHKNLYSLLRKVCWVTVQETLDIIFLQHKFYIKKF